MDTFPYYKNSILRRSVFRRPAAGGITRGKYIPFPSSVFGLLSWRRLVGWFVSVLALEFWFYWLLAKVCSPSDSRPYGCFRLRMRLVGGQFFGAFSVDSLQWTIDNGVLGIGRRFVVLTGVHGSFASGVLAAGAKFSQRAQRLVCFTVQVSSWGVVACPFRGKGCVGQRYDGFSPGYFVWVHRHRPPV